MTGRLSSESRIRVKSLTWTQVEHEDKEGQSVTLRMRNSGLE